MQSFLIRTGGVIQKKKRNMCADFWTDECQFEHIASTFIIFNATVLKTTPHMKYLKYISAQCIFVICIFILADIQGVVGEPPKIVNFTYRTKQLGLIDQTITGNIITLELDQDVYHQVQCPIEFSEANRTQIMPCCSSNTNATECYTPSNAAQTCLDGNGTYINITGTKDPYDYQRYALRVSNYASCHSISILNKAVSGNYNNNHIYWIGQESISISNFGPIGFNTHKRHFIKQFIGFPISIWIVRFKNTNLQINDSINRRGVFGGFDSSAIQFGHITRK
jgi:hypothetical protein